MLSFRKFRRQKWNRTKSEPIRTGRIFFKVDGSLCRHVGVDMANLKFQVNILIYYQNMNLFNSTTLFCNQLFQIFTGLKLRTWHAMKTVGILHYLNSFLCYEQNKNFYFIIPWKFYSSTSQLIVTHTFLPLWDIQYHMVNPVSLTVD